MGKSSLKTPKRSPKIGTKSLVLWMFEKGLFRLTHGDPQPSESLRSLLLRQKLLEQMEAGAGSCGACLPHGYLALREMGT
jgi:hypothetical protein